MKSNLSALPVYSFFALVAMVAICFPLSASAQYKNSSFSLDVGYVLSSQPSSIDANGLALPVDNRPLRLSSFGRIGGETSTKMNDDHWWLNYRLDAQFYSHTKSDRNIDPVQGSYDQIAAEALGTLFGVHGQFGVRYYLFTDRIRPYLQGSLSYLQLFPTGELTGSDCSDPLTCSGASSSNGDVYLPHRQIGAAHFTGGAEFLFARDIGIHIFLDVQRWIIFNTEDNKVINFGLGMIFYT